MSFCRPCALWREEVVRSGLPVDHRSGTHIVICGPVPVSRRFHVSTVTVEK